MSSVHQVSAGGVVFKRLNSDLKICLIARRNKDRLVWCLPKGHIEPDESLEETALREIREETGLTGSIVSPLGDISYQFFEPSTKERIFKKVHFFLIRYESGNTTDHDDEVEAVRWFDLQEALGALEYPGELETLKKAAQKIKLLHEEE